MAFATAAGGNPPATAPDARITAWRVFTIILCDHGLFGQFEGAMAFRRMRKPSATHLGHVKGEMQAFVEEKAAADM